MYAAFVNQGVRHRRTRAHGRGPRGGREVHQADAADPQRPRLHVDQDDESGRGLGARGEAAGDADRPLLQRVSDVPTFQIT